MIVFFKLRIVLGHFGLHVLFKTVVFFKLRIMLCDLGLQILLELVVFFKLRIMLGHFGLYLFFKIIIFLKTGIVKRWLVLKVGNPFFKLLNIACFKSVRVECVSWTITRFSCHIFHRRVVLLLASCTLYLEVPILICSFLCDWPKVVIKFCWQPSYPPPDSAIRRWKVLIWFTTEQLYRKESSKVSFLQT